MFKIQQDLLFLLFWGKKKLVWTKFEMYSKFDLYIPFYLIMLLGCQEQTGSERLQAFQLCSNLRISVSSFVFIFQHSATAYNILADKKHKQEPYIQGLQGGKYTTRFSVDIAGITFYSSFLLFMLTKALQFWSSHAQALLKAAHNQKANLQ